MFQVECPGASGLLGPPAGSGGDVVVGLVVGHAGDGLQVGGGLVGAAGDVGEPHMRAEMAIAAQADQPAQALHTHLLVVDPGFVGRATALTAPPNSPARIRARRHRQPVFRWINQGPRLTGAIDNQYIRKRP
jgi:hypothetical protein